MHCPDEERLHLLSPADVLVATTQGQAQALCGDGLAAQGLTITSGPPRALCMTCLAAATSHTSRPGLTGTDHQIPGRPPMESLPPFGLPAVGHQLAPR